MRAFNSFVDCVREECERRQINQRELSRMSGVHYVTVCKIFNRSFNNPSIGICEKLADSLDIDCRWDKKKSTPKVRIHQKGVTR